MSETRQSLLRAGEQLFAEHGTTGVSAREIVRVAGVGNASALQYHFGDRGGLLRAVLASHESQIDLRRHLLLDRWEESDGLRALVEALVLPLADELAEESGRRYLRIAAEVVNRPGYRVEVDDVDPGDSGMRWRVLIEPLLDPGAVALHRRFAALRFVTIEIGRRAAEPRARGSELFVSQLVDLVVGMLACPISNETREVLESRRARV